MTLERAKVGLLALAVVFLAIIAWQGTGYRTVGGDVTLDPGSTVGISGPVTLAPDTTVGINGSVSLDPNTTVGINGSVPITTTDPLRITLGRIACSHTPPLGVLPDMSGQTFYCQ